MLTTGLGLKKPEDTDNADLLIFIGQNMDTIDSLISGKAATSHTHASITIPDTRNTNDAPSGIAGYSLSTAFKINTSVDSPPVTSSVTYSHIINVAGWDTNGGSGGWPSQISVGDGLAVRQATNATTWGSWRKFWHDGNFNPTIYIKGSIGTTAPTDLGSIWIDTN